MLYPVATVPLVIVALPALVELAVVFTGAAAAMSRTSEEMLLFTSMLDAAPVEGSIR